MFFDQLASCGSDELVKPIMLLYIRTHDVVVRVDVFGARVSKINACCSFLKLLSLSR